jgi:hypothetical protein
MRPAEEHRPNVDSAPSTDSHDPDSHDPKLNPIDRDVGSVPNSLFSPADEWNSERDEPTVLGQAWLGTIIAGGLYPWVISGLMLVIVGIQYRFDEIDVIEGLVSAIPFLATTFFVGMIYAMIMTVPAYGLLQFFRICTQSTLTKRGTAGVFGGLTGFLCTTGGGLLLLPTDNIDVSGALFYGGAVAIAVSLGHLGAITICYLRRDRLSRFYDPFLVPGRQVSIKLLMGVTFGFALFIAACKAAGPTGLLIGIMWSLYVAFQTLLLLLENAWRTRFDQSGSTPGQ